MPDTATTDKLRRWSRGLLHVEAATELLIRSCGGRFVQSGYPWIRSDRDGVAWVDWNSITEDNLGGLSGGEKRMLQAVAALGGGAPVRLGDVATGIDDGHARLLLAAIAHAAQLDDAAHWPE